MTNSNKKAALLLTALAAASVAAKAAIPAEIGPPPPWAYGFTAPASNTTPATPAAAATTPADPKLRRLPGSKLQFTRAQVSDQFGPADWFPQDHPEMPPIVAQGKAPNVIACALCHYPNGHGRPENAAIAGLPEAYILEQLTHFRNDERRTADPRKSNTNLMVQIAKGMTDAEMESAARYFSTQKFPRWIKVVETGTVPKTELGGGMFLTIPNGGREPIDNRIIETPENREAVEELRNPRVGFIAYVPRGSIRKGETIVTRGGGKTTLPCTTCHGSDLKGALNVPPIAGRSPSYIVRAMFDIKAGTRFGGDVELMKPIVANLDDEDLLNVAAYVSSRSP